jgi:hypothetical protein
MLCVGCMTPSSAKRLGRVAVGTQMSISVRRAVAQFVTAHWDRHTHFEWEIVHMIFHFSLGYSLEAQPFARLQSHSQTRFRQEKGRPFIHSLPPSHYHRYRTSLVFSKVEPDTERRIKTPISVLRERDKKKRKEKKTEPCTLPS